MQLRLSPGRNATNFKVIAWSSGIVVWRSIKQTWSSSSDVTKINFLLSGVKSVNYDINCALFREVQRFIMSTNRFSMATLLCNVYLVKSASHWPLSVRLINTPLVM